MKETSELRYTIKELVSRVPLADFLHNCVDIPKFLGCCEACPNFGDSWFCPPYDFDPMEIWNRFSGLRLYARVLIPEDRTQDTQLAFDALEEEKILYLDGILPEYLTLVGALLPERKVESRLE